MLTNDHLIDEDEQIYELVAKELATSPRRGLLVKCMTECEGDEKKAKALYIETRVDEIKYVSRQDELDRWNDIAMSHPSYAEQKKAKEKVAKEKTKLDRFPFAFEIKGLVFVVLFCVVLIIIGKIYYLFKEYFL